LSGEPRFSVVIAAFNAARWIAGSVLGPTLWFIGLPAVQARTWPRR
jgi:hypothetical protein